MTLNHNCGYFSGVFFGIAGNEWLCEVLMNEKFCKTVVRLRKKIFKNKQNGKTTMIEKEQQFNYDVSQLIIFNQLMIEANERLKKYPSLYRQRLKKLSNDLHKELEKHIPIYDEIYFKVEDFMLITQQQLEFLIPMLRSLRLDEIATLPHLIDAYKIDREKTEKFLHKTLNKELK